MTREEEIIEAASKYSEYEFNECATNNGFIKGAQWADNHPINVWHNASEEPFRDRVFLVEFEVGRYGFQTFFIFENDIKFNWSEWTKEVRLLRWAYISDLLPKE